MLTNVRSPRRELRQARVRQRVRGTDARPRLTVFRSLNHIYAQLVDDLSGRTLLSVSSRDATLVADVKGTKGKVAAGRLVGKALAARAKEKGIDRVCFDRGGYLYHGRVKAVADGAREGGLTF